MAGSAPEASSPLKITLETYWILNRQKQLNGQAILEASSAGSHLHLQLISCKTNAPVWQESFSLDEKTTQVAFQLPVGRLEGGDYLLRGERTGTAAPATAQVGLAIRQSGPALSGLTSTAIQNPLRFVRQIIGRILEQQAVRLGGRPDGPLCIVGANRSARSYRSLGAKVDGRYQTYFFPENPIELNPVRMDIDAWLVLDRLSELSGDQTYTDLLNGMIFAFTSHGFDSRSGLPYFGEEADFDVRHQRGIARGGHYLPKFKPSFHGHNITLSLDRIWRIAPQAAHRMARSAFWGLITDSDRMDYNRFCLYDFSDADRKHPQPPGTGHCAFDSAGAALIHLWAWAFAHAGDLECLDWAQRMADKWQEVQHPQTGLFPDFFGADASQKPYPLPGKWAASRSVAYTAALWAAAARQFEKRPTGEKLALQLTAMARSAVRGTIQYAYDPGRRLFIENLNFDGTPYDKTARYCFRTQAEKDAAVAEDPAMAQVFVWEGTGLYDSAAFWDHFAGSHIPLQLACVAELTGDPQLARLLDPIATAIAEESSRQPEAFTTEGRWTFRATGEYIQFLMILHRLTGKAGYVDWARQMADQELARLEQVQWPQWWRLAQRAPLLLGLLSLHETDPEPFERSNP